jgi:hypothetical protein
MAGAFMIIILPSRRVGGVMVVGFILLWITFTIFHGLTTRVQMADVKSVDWLCDYKRARHQKIVLKRDCSGEDGFLEIKRNPAKRYAGDIDGTAEVTVRYQTPDDAKWHEGNVEYSSSWAEFYTVEPGQKIPVRVNRWNADDISL